MTIEDYARNLATEIMTNSAMLIGELYYISGIMIGEDDFIEWYKMNHTWPPDTSFSGVRIISLTTDEVTELKIRFG